MTRNKESAEFDWWKMTKESWTYKRLTQDERDRLTEAIDSVNLFGSYKQRFEYLHSVYYAFILALGYDATGWRETDRNTPNF